MRRAGRLSPLAPLPHPPPAPASRFLRVPTPIAPGDAPALLRALVRCDSRNPSLVPGAPGEALAARTLASVLEGWGFRVTLADALPGRPNVIARIGSAGRGRSLMLNGHLDVVGIDGMIHAPFDAAERDGRLYGRGSADMKAGVAAMCAAAARAAAAHELPGEVIICAVADEEWASAGTRAIVASGLRADAAIVTEPTSLAIMPAHRGFVWITVEVAGRAAHGSRYDIGIDAIRLAGLFLAELDALDANVLPTHTHEILGHASLHASTISGGTGMSTYPDHCTLRIERRTVPGETPASVLAEVNAACARLRARRPEFTATVTMDLAQSPSDVAVNAPIVRALATSIAVVSAERRAPSAEPAPLAERRAPSAEPAPLAERRAPSAEPDIQGMSAWTDAALLNDAGIPAICYGPGDIALAHAAEEFVPLAELETATRVMADLIARWCGGSGPWPA